MILIKQGPPDTGILTVTACDRHNLYPSQFSKGAANLWQIDKAGTLSGSLKAETGGHIRKLHNVLPVELGKRFAAASLLELAVGGMPVKPLTHLARQRPPRNTRVVCNHTVYPSDNISRKFLSTHTHECQYTTFEQRS